MRLPDGGLSRPFVFALTLPDTVLLVGLASFFLLARHSESLCDVAVRLAPAGARDVVRHSLLIPLSFLVVITVLLVVQVDAAVAAQRAAQPAAGPGAHRGSTR